MLVTCPYCLRKILPKADSRCPACNTEVDETAPEPVHEITTLKKGQRMPKVCFHCAAPATSFTMVKIEGAAMEHQVVGRFILRRVIAELFGGVSGSMSGAQGDSFRIDLPSCALCTDMEESRFLRGADQASRTIRVAVHPEFAAALKREG